MPFSGLLRPRRPSRVAGLLAGAFLFAAFAQAFAAERWLIQSARPGAAAKDAGQALAKTLRDARIVENYGAQFVVEGLDDNGALEARKAGFVASRLAPAQIVQLRGGPRDTAGEPSWTKGEGQRPAGQAQGKQLFLVQFSGPIRSEWLERLSAAGLQPAQYIPHFGYLVYGDPNALSKPQIPPQLHWAGPFREADRIDPALYGAVLAPAPPEARQRIIVQYFALPEAQATAHALAQYARGPIKPAKAGSHYTARLEAHPNDLPAIARLPLVYNVEPEPFYELFGERQALIVAGQLTPSQGCPAPPGIGSRYADFLSRKGVDGSGLVVHIMDNGLDKGDSGGAPGSAHPDLLGRVAAILNATADPLGDGGGGHGTLNAGIMMGTPQAGTPSPRTDAEGFFLGQGIAPGAHVLAHKIFRNSGAFDIGTKTFAELVAQAAPFDPAVSSNSWGANVFGAYTADCADFDALARDCDSNAPGDQGLLFCFATGNSSVFDPHGAIGAPATAKNVIAVGATENCNPGETDGCEVDPSGADNLNEIASFSNRGPAADGRLGVTIVAPGTHVCGAASTSPNFDGTTVCGTALNGTSPSAEHAYYPPGQTDYTWSSGTSHSCPAVAGAVALFHQYCLAAYGNRPSPALVKAALANSALDIAAGLPPGGPLAHTPNPDIGWGLLNLDRLIPDAGQFSPGFVADQTAILRETGDVAEFVITAIGPSTPLKITLCWTDPPGIPGAGPALINDLDLQVVQGPALYLGNVFDAGVSQPGGLPDRLENLEAVFLDSPSGTFTVRVVAAFLAADGVPSSPGAADQDFALYVSGGVNQSPNGVVLLDREFYAVEDTVVVTVSDSDLLGQPSVDVSMNSDSDPTGKIVALPNLYPATGLFRGSASISASGGPAALRVASGDEIRAVYQDANDGTGAPATALAKARVDGQPPAVSNIRVGAMTPDSAQILFQTDEPARSKVFYGPDSLNLTNSVEDSAFELEHSALLTGLASDALYAFRIQAFDQVNNSTLTDCHWLRTPKLLCFRSFDMESGLESPFTHSADEGTDDWQIIEDAFAHSPSYVWFAGDTGFLKDASLALPAPPEPLPPESQLIFWHTYGFEYPYDGAVVECRVGEGPWQDLGPFLVEGAYNTRLLSSPLADRLAWSGGTPGLMTRVRADLSSFAGQRVSFRFRIGCDAIIGGAGWFLDDIQICSVVGSRAEVRFDAEKYRAGQSLRIFLSDADLEGNPSALVHLESSSEGPPGESIGLAPIGLGQFSAAVPVVADSFGADGRIGVSNGDLITVWCLDADDGTGVAAVAADVAQADLACPTLLENTPSTVTSRVAYYLLKTDEPAQIAVSFGTEGATSQTVSSDAFAQEWTLVVSDLLPCSQYRVSIATTDTLGNGGVATGDGPAFVFLTADEAAAFYDDLEPAEDSGWLHGASLGVDDWSVEPFANAKSPPHAWFASDAATVKDAFLQLGPVDTASGDLLIFWHTYEFERGATVGFDGGVLEISDNGGASWHDMAPGFAYGSSYDLRLSSEFGNPLQGRLAFSGGHIGPMRSAYVRLSRWAGPQRLIRFRIGCDTSEGAQGWRIDEVRVVHPFSCVPLHNAVSSPWPLYP